ncbi:hypothetical protein E2C01_027597 [Portunus trituberculatus]|uniref:Uncharacterized protein n=1 Tax=Portunus trituberculatus TaxID=210409 RepID=A0A5B7EP49_PORTR|nr:hypothetical protein [Portunus trituberculatus]
MGEPIISNGSSLKVCAHLEVVGKCGGADHLTLCLPRSRGKRGRRLLGSFSFPSVGDVAGQHRSARILVPIGRVAKKDGATPVRVDFLAGESLVARREISLADLLAGLKANRIGRCSSLFFSLKAGQAEDAAVAVYYSGRLLEEPRQPQEDQNELAKTEEHASLPPQAGQTKISLPPYAVYTNPTLIPEVTYCGLTPKVTLIDLGEGHRWGAPQIRPWQERGHTPQAGETMTSLTPEVIHRDLGDGQRWAASQTRPWQERAHTPQVGEALTSLTPEIIHRDLGDGKR